MRLGRAQVSSQSRLLFILCLPAQLPTVVASMKGHVRRRCLIVSTVLGVDERKLMNLLRTNIVVCARTVRGFCLAMPVLLRLLRSSHRTLCSAPVPARRLCEDGDRSCIGGMFVHYRGLLLLAPQPPMTPAGGQSMDKYRQELLDEALGKEPVVATTYDSESDGDSVAAAEQAALAAVDDAAAAARTTGTEADAIVAGVTSHARKDSHSGGVDGDDGEEHKARPGASTEADIIADAVHQESLHSRAQRLRTATAATKVRVPAVWRHVNDACDVGWACVVVAHRTRSRRHGQTPMRQTRSEKGTENPAARHTSSASCKRRSTLPRMVTDSKTT